MATTTYSRDQIIDIVGKVITDVEKKEKFKVKYCNWAIVVGDPTGVTLQVTCILMTDKVVTHNSLL